MFLHILSIIISIIIIPFFIYELYRLLSFGNAGGLAATISRPLLGRPMKKMLIGLIIWLVEIAVGVCAVRFLISLIL